MSKGKVFITDYGFANLSYEETVLNAQGYDIYFGQCKTEDELIEQAVDADALLVQWAPVTDKVISHLKHCRIIVRYGIGTDNVDLNAANRKKIPVCNVPDYCIPEVADHTVSLALALARQLTETSNRMRKGVWKIVPPRKMPAFRNMLFATVGYGRIAREVLHRIKAFGFTAGAYDPYVKAEEMKKNGVEPLTLEELLVKADILSLHLPLSDSTRHLINADTISKMKKEAIIINTSRGGLIDTIALANALQKEQIGAAGLDVFETEPLPADHPLWLCENAMLTSHTAWYSEMSVPVLQRMAAEEVLRGLEGLALKNRVV